MHLTSLVCLRLITKGVPDNVDIQGCFQMAKVLCIPPEAVLSGLLILTIYVISPAVIIVPDTNWREAALIFDMPTGSTKSSLYLNRVLGDATCERMGDKMAENGGRLLGLYV